MTVFATPAIKRELAKYELLGKENQGNQKAEWEMLAKNLNSYLSLFRISRKFT